jgi:hypothetical protein
MIVDLHGAAMTAASYLKDHDPDDDHNNLSKLVGNRTNDHDASPANDETPAARTTWAAVNVGPILDGTLKVELPTMFSRADGARLVYPRRIHAFNGESESGKSLLAQAVVVEELNAGHHVVYVDFEDRAENVIHRLQLMGADDDAIRDQFHYIRPEEKLIAGPQHDDFAAELACRPTLVVLDGVTEAMTQAGLNLESNTDVATWLAIPRGIIVATGAAVIVIDHVVKAVDMRGRWALGAQHKMAGIDVAYSVTVVEQFAPGRNGRVRLTVSKDRPGQVRAQSTRIDKHDVAADAQITSNESRLTVDLVAPDQTAGKFRPTGYMENVSRHLTLYPGASKNDLRKNLGNGEYVDAAVKCLADERYVEVKPEGQRHAHYNLRPFSEVDDLAGD